MAGSTLSKQLTRTKFSKTLFTKTIFLFVIPLLMVFLAGYFYIAGGRYVSTENAYIKAELIAVSSDIDGRVVEVAVKNNQSVNAGDLLFRLDAEPAQIALLAAQAELMNVGQRIASLRTRHQQSKLRINSAEERIRFLQLQLQRQHKLKRQGHGSGLALESADHELNMAVQQLEIAQQASEITLVELAGNADIETVKHPLYLAAKAKMDEANRLLRLTRIFAPENGTLTNLNLQRGEYVEAGKAVFSLVASDEIWVEANLKESQLTHIIEKQHVSIVVDAYPDTVIDGYVHSFAPATGAEFAILPPQNATGNWVKVVQRIPVRIEFNQPLENAQLSLPYNTTLRAGMTATVQIDTERERNFSMVAKNLLNKVFAHQ